MAQSLRDRLALIYTSAGSMRRTAGMVGLSHQQIGRILRGEYSPRAAILTDPGVKAAVSMAYSIHRDITREQARTHGLPFFSQLPVYMARLPMKQKVKGKRVLGDRVSALHTHWLSNEQRNFFIALAHQSRRFVAASVQSTVNLVVYNKQADARMRALQRPRNQSELAGRDYVVSQIRQQIVRGPIYTPLAYFSFDLFTTLDKINDSLMTKHAPATGEEGTAFAESVLLQVDHRENENVEFRKAHPFAPSKKASKSRKPATRKSVSAKTSGNKKRSRSNQAARKA